MPELWQLALILVAGLTTGILSGMFGVGGAIVSTPAIRALGATPLDAIGSTLPSMLPSSISGTLRYHRERLVRWRAVAVVAGFGALATVGGSILSQVVPGEGHVLMIATAGLVGITSWRMARSRDEPESPVPEAAPDAP
ncbi:MAG TPA: sulfite exporter TauE/SafE family protein, partial [Acidimicrobiia bacterium]|nr:sulfite exporter TauE/SafE family protein [Acidimicrobiia bacterium]